jgi:hypothetical protein
MSTSWSCTREIAGPLTEPRGTLGVLANRPPIAAAAATNAAAATKVLTISTATLRVSLAGGTNLGVPTT